MTVMFRFHFVVPAKAQTTSLAHLRVAMQGQIRFLGRQGRLPLIPRGCVTLSRHSSGPMARIITVVQTANYDDTGQAFTFDLPGTVVACIPFSCFAGPLTTDAGTEFYPLTAGCTYPAFYTLTSMSEDGTWTSEGEAVDTVTIQSSEYDAARGVLVTRASVTSTGMGTATLTIPEDQLPANDVTLEVPASDATMSGIGLISGWACLGGTLEAEISDATGGVSTVALSHGTSRADTESVCGDRNNGFSATVNWSLFAAGPKTIRLLQNGAEVGAARAFSVLPFDREFISGASGMCSIGDFPTAGESATVEWDEPQQRFVVTGIN